MSTDSGESDSNPSDQVDDEGNDDNEGDDDTEENEDNNYDEDDTNERDRRRGIVFNIYVMIGIDIEINFRFCVRRKFWYV